MTSSLNPIDGIEPNLAGSIPWWLGFKIVQMMGLTPRGAEGRGPNGKVGHNALNDFFSESNQSNGTKFDWKHTLVFGIQNCTNDGPDPQGG